MQTGVLQGELQLDGRPLQSLSTPRGASAAAAAMRRVSAYVPQADGFWPTLTCEETVTLHAALMLPPHAGSAEREQRAAEVAAALGLRRCAATLVGGPSPSGGTSIKVCINK